MVFAGTGQASYPRRIPSKDSSHGFDIVRRRPESAIESLQSAPTVAPLESWQGDLSVRRGPCPDRVRLRSSSRSRQDTPERLLPSRIGLPVGMNLERRVEAGFVRDTDTRAVSQRSCHRSLPGSPGASNYSNRCSIGTRRLSPLHQISRYVLSLASRLFDEYRPRRNLKARISSRSRSRSVRRRPRGGRR